VAAIQVIIGGVNPRRFSTLLPLLLLLLLPIISTAQAADPSIDVAPPDLPVYEQPPIPQDGFLWTPGYWAWSDDIDDYYWVPGTWVAVPQIDYLWTPGYWGLIGAAYIWHSGYWGPHIGFYGGVNYGYGYGGRGYQGGYWRNGHLFYNQSVTNVGNTRITNVYNTTVYNDTAVSRVSFNGGSRGVQARPTASELSAAHEPHVAATPLQRQHERAAHGTPALRFSANYGHPPIAATSRPGAFSGDGTVAAKHTGTLSFVHQPAPREAAPDAAQSRAAAPRELQTRQSARAPPQAAPAEVRSHEIQPPRAPRAPPQTRPNPPPRPAQPPPEQEQDHDRR
jgi:hypothetical protein